MPSVGLRAGETSPVGEVSSHANLSIGPRLSLGGVGAKLGPRTGDKGAGAGGSNAERWAMSIEDKLEKFLRETKLVLDSKILHPTNITSHYQIRFRGETAEMTTSRTPINLIVGLRNGSIGLISAVIYAFACQLNKKPFMIYMARDSFHSEITTHFLFDETFEVERARAVVLLAEMLAGVRDITEIDFEEIKKKAERFLSEHF